MNIRNLSALLTLGAMLSFSAAAQTTNLAPKPPGAAVGTNSGRASAPVAPSQRELASTNAVFAAVEPTAAALKTALDAHDLAGGLKQVDRAGGFKGKVSAVFEPRGGAMAILNFDPEYRTAMTAVVKKDDFGKFPDLKKLIGKEVLVTGKFINYQGRAELILTNLAQVEVIGVK